MLVYTTLIGAASSAADKSGTSFPAWATVVIALASGVVGAVVSTLLRIRHERRSEALERRIAAADDFASAFSKALAKIRDVIEDWQEAGEPVDPPGHDEAIVLVDEATHLVYRVQLLFGRASPAGVASTNTISDLRVIIRILRGETGNPWQAFEAAWTGFEDFMDAAADAVEDGGLTTLTRRKPEAD